MADMKISELIAETTLENQDLFIITDFATTESRSVQADHILQYVENNIDLNLTISDVIGLQGALDNKAPLNHTHPISQIVGLDARLTELEDFDNSTFITEAVGNTPASVTINGVTVSLDGSGGTGGFDPRFPSTGNNVGYYWRITGTNGTSVSVSPTDVKTDLGLDQVNNTSDLAKPISNLTQQALNGKADNADVFSGNYNDLTNRPVTITGLQATEIATNTLKRSYPLADENKLATVEPNADVTDTANVYLALGANASTGRINYFLNERGQWVQIVGDGTSFDTTANYSVIGDWDFDGAVDLTDATVTLPAGLLPENPFNGFIQTNSPSTTNKFACWTASGQITWVPATGGSGGTTYSATLTSTGPNDTVITYSPAQTVSGLGDGTTGSITATIAPAPGFEFVTPPVGSSFTFNYVINGANATQVHAFDPTTYATQPITYRVTLNATGPANTVITYNPSQVVTNISDGVSGTIVATIAPAAGFVFVTTPATTDYTLNYVINGSDITASHVFDATTYQVRSDTTTFTATLGAASPPNTTVQFNPSAVVAGLLDGQTGSIVATVVANAGYEISGGTTTYTFNYTINGANATDSVDFSNAPQNVTVVKHDLIAIDFDESSLIVNGSGGTLNLNVRGVVGTQFSLALATVTPAGWITSGALGATSGVIPNDGEFETTITIPSTTNTVNRTAAITATNSNDSTDTVTTGLFRQQHTMPVADNDLVANVGVVTTSTDVTFSGTITGGDDFPVTVELFDTDPGTGSPTALQTGTLNALGTHTFTAIDTTGFADGDHDYWIRFTDTAGAPDVVTIMETITIAAESGMGIDGFPSDMYRTDSSLFSTLEYVSVGFSSPQYDVRVLMPDGNEATYITTKFVALQAAGVPANVLQIAVATQNNFTYTDNAEILHTLELTDTSVSPNVVTTTEWTWHDDAAEFSEFIIGPSWLNKSNYNYQSSTNQVGAIGSVVTSYGIDWVSGSQTSVPVGSNRVTGTTSIVSSALFINGGDGTLPTIGESTVRFWVSDGTNFTYGPATVIEISGFTTGFSQRSFRTNNDNVSFPFFAPSTPDADWFFTIIRDSDGSQLGRAVDIPTPVTAQNIIELRAFPPGSFTWDVGGTYTITVYTDNTLTTEVISHQFTVGDGANDLSFIEVGPCVWFGDTTTGSFTDTLVMFTNTRATAGVSSYGFDYVTGLGATTVPVGSNRTTVSNTFDELTTNIVQWPNVVNSLPQGDYSMRGWVSDGTNFVYGPITSSTKDF